MTSTDPHHGMTITAPLPDGRLLIACTDPTIPEDHSPLQRALSAAENPLMTED